jgi:hypothetical protein
MKSGKGAAELLSLDKNGATHGKHNVGMLPPQALSSLTLRRTVGESRRDLIYIQWLVSECKDTLQELHLGGMSSFKDVASITRCFAPSSGVLRHLSVRLPTISVEIFKLLSEMLPLLETLSVEIKTPASKNKV